LNKNCASILFGHLLFTLSRKSWLRILNLSLNIFKAARKRLLESRLIKLHPSTARE